MFKKIKYFIEQKSNISNGNCGDSKKIKISSDDDDNLPLEKH